MRAFEQYVDAKWPLRVYAIEPVIAQQNVADGFGRRTQSAFDLVAVGPGRAARRRLAGLAADTARRPRTRTAIRLEPHDGRVRGRPEHVRLDLLPQAPDQQGSDGRLLTDIALLLERPRSPTRSAAIRASSPASGNAPR